MRVGTLYSHTMSDVRINRRELLWLGLIGGAVLSVGCDADPGALLPARASGAADLDGFRLVARLAHVTDTHLVDEESPARFAGAHQITQSAWRSYESYSTQLLDGVIRGVNRIHASGRTIDFLLHTGDACDNAQANELGWLLDILDGRDIKPRTGPDDRPASARPAPELDPHAPFEAQGLYQAGRHGPEPSIPWYAAFGNHDAHSIGVFPTFATSDGRRVAPLPLDVRPGLVLPVYLDPEANFAHGNVTPANPGPPALLELPRAVQPNPARAFFSKQEYIQALDTTDTGPAGHGFAAAGSGTGWYALNPVDGLRLIVLDTTDRRDVAPGYPYHEGAMTRAQLAFLRGELDGVRTGDEMVVVVTHHPSSALVPLLGSEVFPDEFRHVLRSCPNVVLHLAGHRHINRVVDRGGYLEIETCSTLDWPQEGRLVEIWRDESNGDVAIVYEVFTHGDTVLAPLGADPLKALREEARRLAADDKGAAARAIGGRAQERDSEGTEADRRGMRMLRRSWPRLP